MPLGGLGGLTKAANIGGLTGGLTNGGGVGQLTQGLTGGGGLGDLTGGLTGGGGGGGKVGHGFNGEASDVKQFSGAKKPKERNTIAKRNLADAIDCETLLWRAYCDEPDSVLEYMAKDCVVLDPVTLGSSHPVTYEELEERLRKVKPWSAYKIDKDTRVVSQIGLMSMSTMCKVTLYRMGDKKKDNDQVEAVTSAVWRQTAGAEWECCSMLVGYAE
ncbi:hypothetical protein F5883DRAFT_572211 [Diaporthe sp. PMI_573]|nr:hypothetical protein F5883DRAFT_572211 [Diaporthaceae sp. PMI_573]